MSDFTDCDFGAITPDLILRSLIGCVDSILFPTAKGLRVELNQALTTTPVHCLTFEDFNINLRRCLAMAEDGYVTLRINAVSGRTTNCEDCINATTWYDLLNSLFAKDSEGLVYLNVILTNASPE